MLTTGQIIRMRRLDLELTLKQVADHMHVSDKQVSNWEADRASLWYPDQALRLGALLGLALDEMAGQVPLGVSPTGKWFVRWQTRRRGQPVIDKHELTAVYSNGRLTLNATGNYNWTGDFQILGESVMGTFRAVDPGRLWHKGTMYFWLDPSDGQSMIGHWVGETNEDKIGTGWGAMARSVEEADRLIAALVEHGWHNVKEWPRS